MRLAVPSEIMILNEAETRLEAYCFTSLFQLIDDLIAQQPAEIERTIDKK